MKFGELTIHNIASIDDATIDFAGDVLGKESLFLISGETGAGKSTILDCICLALYNATPRLLNQRSQSSYTQGEDTYNITGPQQLLRRGTADGFIQFSFIGTNKQHYTATWSIKRSRKKVDGRLQGIIWELVCHDSHMTLNLKEPILHEITQHAVGLDFKQFCRTVMLAQGQFNLFLTGSEKDKSEILEKLTDTGLYSTIGQRIFEATQQAKQQLDTLQLAAKGISPLSPAQRLTIDNELSAVKAVIKELTARCEILDSQINWGDKCLTQEKALQAAQQQFDNTKKLLQSPESQQQRLMVEQWQKSSVARTNLNELRQAQEAHKHEIEQQKNIALDYARLCGGIAWTQAQHQQHIALLRQTEQALTKRQARQHIYEQCTLIIAHLDEASHARQAVDTYNKKLNDLEQRLPALTDAQQAATTAHIKCNAQLAEKKKTITQKNEELQSLDPERIEIAQQELALLLQLLNEAEKQCLLLDEKQKQAKHAQIELAEALTEYQNSVSNIEPLTLAAKQATLALNKAQSNYDKIHASLEDWACDTRSRLKQGDTCPVCGKVIDEVLTDSHFKQLEHPFEQELEQARTQAQNSAAQLKTQQQECQRLEKLTQRLKKTSDNANMLYASQKATVAQALIRCGKKDGTDQAQSWIAQQLQKCQQQKTLLDEKQRAIRLLRQDIDNKIAQQNQLQKQVNDASVTLNQAERKTNECRSEIEKLAALITNGQERERRATQQVNIYWKSDDWHQAWGKNPQAFVSAIKDETSEYAQLQEQYADLRNHIQQAEQMLQRIESIRPRDFIPAQQNTVIAEVPDLENSLLKLNNDIIASNERLAAIIRQEKQLQSQIDHFLNLNPDITHERLNRLAEIDESDVMRQEKDLKALTASHDSARGALDSIQTQLDALHRNRPEGLADKPDWPTIRTERQALEAQITRNRQSLGGLLQQINDDDKRHQQVSKLQEEINLTRNTYEHWEFLNKHLGTEGGKKFQTIAQSFILGDLLHKANHFMQQFNDRYILTCQHDSLNILLEDQTTGTLSSVNTFSGGEGFMAALALALALAQINAGHVDVDTIFIDEGFGSLSSNYLERVMNTLRSLRDHSGRRVGIISHVDTLKESIATRIHVQRVQGGALSRVIILQ